MNMSGLYLPLLLCHWSALLVPDIQHVYICVWCVPAMWCGLCRRQAAELESSAGDHQQKYEDAVDALAAQEQEMAQVANTAGHQHVWCNTLHRIYPSVCRMHVSIYMVIAASVDCATSMQLV